MRRMLMLALSLVLTACMPAFLQPASNPAPVVDTQATTIAIGVTFAAQTLQALPTATLMPTDTPVILAPTETQTATLVPTVTGTLPTATIQASATLAATGTGPTATNVTGTPGTVFPTFVASGTPTLGIRYYGTIPPLVPSGRIVMINRSHAEAYISFQCINKEGTLSVLEYPVPRWIEEKIPSGKCKYVAWVGGRQFVGNFSLDTGGQKTINLYKDRIGIK